jgi:hypothetical protein
MIIDRIPNASEILAPNLSNKFHNVLSSFEFDEVDSKVWVN